MFQRLPLALAQVKANNASEKLLNEIRQTICFLYWIKQISKEVYNIVMNWTNLYKRMDTIFMNFENSKKCDPHRLQLNLFDKINFKMCVKHLALSNLSIYYSSKI